MKVTFFLLLAFFLQVSAKTYSQQVKVSLEYENVELSKVLKSLERQTNLYFFFNDRDLDTRQKVSVSVKDEALENVLRALFDGKYAWEVVNNMIVLKHEEKPQVQAPQEVKTVRVTGVVKDEKGEALPGVTVIIKGTNVGTSTDMDGRYTMALPGNVENVVLVYSFVGMEVQEIAYKGQTEINVTMKEEASEMDEVVVTGIFKKAKESYTGAVTSVSKEDLKVYKGQNLLQTLKNIDVSINMAVDNLNGSNPNNLPQINIRGNSSLPMNVAEYNQDASNAVNTPLIILDGFEIALERLMDYNDEEIESINILKDAAATAIYGSRGSNGVIVVVTKQPEVGKLRVNAEVGIDIEAPDLTSYHLLNAAEKLQLEWDLGLYEGANAEMDMLFKRAYSKRLREIAAGTDTDWLGKPLRTGVGSHYNLRLEGGSEEFRWSATVGYKDTRGAMKDSYRKAFNGSLTLMYKVKNFTFKNYASYGVTRSTESKYGNFNTYVKQQPYNAPYDENGKLIRMFDGFMERYEGYQNPLYDATLNSFDRSALRTLSDNFSMEWQPLAGLTVRGQVGISAADNTHDVFLPAEHSTFVNNEDEYESGDDFLRRGSYDYTTGRSNTYSGNITVSYNKTFADKHQLYIGADYALEGKSSYNYLISAEGFTDEDVNFLATARQYAKDEGPSGNWSKSRRLGFTGNANYIYDNRYYVDLSARVDGSSTFGSEKKYAPFWSAGIGWNLHNEHFMEGFFANILRLKASYGQTGTQQGDAGANTLYKFLTDNYYMSWTGSELQGLGNPYLTWQKTDEFNFGVEFGLWNSRFKGEFNVYTKTTNNLLSNMDIPHSNGFSSYVDNVGEVKNNGWEASASVYVMRDAERDINWMVSGQLTYNKNKISKLSEAVKAQNQAYLNGEDDVEIANLFYEGRPQNGIYVVRSLGIDPSTGKEIYLDKDGNRTDIWKASNKVYAGQSDPRYRGIASTMFMWKGLTVNLSMGFHWGGKVYNQTIIDRVEMGRTELMASNVDARALHDRWMKPGDVVPFKGYDESITRATSRFVMNDKVLELQSASVQWKWDNDWVKKNLRASSVTFGVNMSDIWHWSTVKMERGVYYPFARNIQGSIKFLF